VGDRCRELPVADTKGRRWCGLPGRGEARGPAAHEPAQAWPVCSMQLEVLTHSSTKNTIEAAVDGTRLLAFLPIRFDAVLAIDQDFSPARAGKLESRHLQRFIAIGSGLHGNSSLKAPGGFVRVADQVEAFCRKLAPLVVIPGTTLRRRCR